MDQHIIEQNSNQIER